MARSSSPLDRIPFRQLEPLLDTLFEGVIVTDARGVVMFVNKTARLLHHGGEAPRPGTPLSDTNPQDWVEVKRVLASGQAQTGRVLALPETEALVSRVPLYNGREIAGVVSSMQDISLFECIAPRLASYRRLHREFESLLEQDGDACLIVDREGLVLRVNAAYERLAALGRQAVLGRKIGDLTRDPARVAPLVREVLRKEMRGIAEIRLPDGADLLISATPLLDDQGGLIMVLVRIRDMRELEALREPFRPDEGVSPEIPLRPAAAPAGKNDRELDRICAAEGLIVRSAAMSGVVRQALKASLSDRPILLQGESGVGKSMLASLIHNNSPRRKHPLVVINCGAIPEALMESELFGYEKGAFTGAAPQGKAGLLESANKGTVFFDEIGDLKYPLQVKLLEVIETKSFLRVGSTRRVSVDIRVIAATNRDLERDVEEGLFRKDLFYRLNVIPLALPPLRERREDIEVMALDIVARYNAGHKERKRLSPDVLRWLLRHPFSGNVRELVNIMEWMLVMGEGPTLELHDLPVGLRKGMGRAQPPSASPEAPELPESPGLSEPEETTAEGGFAAAGPEAGETAAGPLPAEDMLPLKTAMRRMEEEYLRRVIAACPSLQDAARVLEVHFSTLWRKMVLYGIVREKEGGDA